MPRLATRFLAVAILLTACDAPPATPPPAPASQPAGSGSGSASPDASSPALSAVELEERIAAHYAALKELPTPEDVRSQPPSRKSAPGADLAAVGQNQCPGCSGPLAQRALPASGGYTEISVTAHYCLPCRRYWVVRVGGAMEGTHSEWYGAFDPLAPLR